jgi:hypothetical protein
LTRIANPGKVEDMQIGHHWQAEVPEADGLYAAIWVDHSTFLVELGVLDDGGRIALCLSDGEEIGLEEVSWWLVPAIPLPPLPEED